MKPYKASFANALILIVLSLWAYFAATNPSITSFIPVVIGVALLLLNKGLQRENPLLSHIAVVLTLLVLIGLVKPLVGSIVRGNPWAFVRVALMILSTLVALVSFVQSFIRARQNPKSK